MKMTKSVNNYRQLLKFMTSLYIHLKLMLSFDLCIDSEFITSCYALVKGTPFVFSTLKKKFFKNLVFFIFVDVCISLFCGTLICLLPFGNSFKTCIISVDLGKAFPILNRVAIHVSAEDILRYHTISFNTLNMLVTRKYRFSKKIFLSVLQDQTSVESL